MTYAEYLAYVAAQNAHAVGHADATQRRSYRTPLNETLFLHLQARAKETK